MTEPHTHPYANLDPDNGRDTVTTGAIDDYLGRKLLDQMSDAELTALYERVEFYEAATKRMQDRAEAATGRAILATQRAEQAEAAITRIRAVTDEWAAIALDGYAVIDMDDAATIIRAALDEPKEPGP